MSLRRYLTEIEDIFYYHARRSIYKGEVYMADKNHDVFFARLIDMMQLLSVEKSVTLKELTERYNVAERTIYRDIKRLSFFPLELRKGVIYLEGGYDLSRPDLNRDEIFIAELALSAIYGIDARVDKQLHSIRAKLTTPTFFNPYNVKTQGYEARDKNAELLNKIEDAIIKRNFAKVRSNDVVSLVEPYKVVAFGGIWYLLARDKEDEKIKTYLISAIEEFRASSKSFSTEYIDIDAVLQNVHTAWFDDGNSFSVKVKVKREIAHYFKLKKHLTSQEIVKENSDGSLVVTFDVTHDEDVDNLIKAWLPHIEVLQPERFRKRLILELETYVKDLKNINII